MKKQGEVDEKEGYEVEVKNVRSERKGRKKWMRRKWFRKKDEMNEKEEGSG
jgi:hypothetical protein